jgi:hypothetical protein
VENTFLSISHMVDHLMPYLTPIKSLVLKIGWNSAKIVPELTTPILYLAGGADQLVPHPHMLQLCKLSLRSVLVQLHVIENGTHNETWLQGGNAYWDKIRSFMVQAIEHAPRIAETSTSTSTTIPSTGTTHDDGAAIDTAVGFGTDAAACPAPASGIPTMPSNLWNIAQEGVRGRKDATSTSKKDI